GRRSEHLSQEITFKDRVKARKVAILVADGFDLGQVNRLRERLQQEGAQARVIAKYLGRVRSAGGEEIEVDMNHVSTASVMFDAVVVPGGGHVDALREEGDAVHFVAEAFKHCKPVAAAGEAIALLREAGV